MSLINDALKRAKAAQQKNIPSGVTPMRPIESTRKERDFNLFVPVMIILLIVTAIFCVGLALAKHTARQIVIAPAISTPPQVEAVAAPAAPAPPPDVIGPGAINTDAPKPTRIQGIVSDPVHPWAIISGKTVYVGDLVEGMRVTAISRNAITLVGNGRTNRLVVGQQ
jgi:hypothetical protein